MNWESALIRVLAERQYFLEFNPLIKAIESSLGENVQAVIAVMRRFYKDNASANEITLGSIIPYMKLLFDNPTDEQKDKMQAVTLILSRTLSLSLERESVQEVRQQLGGVGLAKAAQDVLRQYISGELEEDLGESLSHCLDTYQNVSSGISFMPIKKTTEQILTENDPDGGLEWPLQGLNFCLRTMHPGDFVIVAAPNNIGKSSFAIQLAVSCAKQLPKDGRVLYLNNEGVGDHLLLRMRQQALNLSIEDMHMLIAKGEDLEKLYLSEMKADKDKIMVIDCHDAGIGHVRNLLIKYKPDVVVLDSIDHIAGFADAAREDIKYKKLYNWFRAQAANPKYRHICIGTTQISAEGFSEIYPPKHCLESSKTAKQSQTDVQIHINGTEDQPLRRFVWVPRSKRFRTGKNEAHSKFECTIDSRHGAYLNAKSKHTPVDPDKQKEEQHATNN